MPWTASPRRTTTSPATRWRRGPASSSRSTSGTLVEKDERHVRRVRRAIRQQAPFLDFAPIIAISAKTGQRVGRVLEAALEIAAERRRRIPTAALNAWLREATLRRPAPTVRGKQSALLLRHPGGIEPPTFVLFASEAASIHFSYKRYLENQLRRRSASPGTPIRLIFRERARRTASRDARDARLGRGRPQERG